MNETTILLGGEKKASGMAEKLRAVSSSPAVLFAMIAIVAAIAGFLLLDLYVQPGGQAYYPLREKALASYNSGPLILGEPRARSVSESGVRSRRTSLQRTRWKIAAFLGLTILLLYFVLVLVSTIANTRESASRSEALPLVLQVEKPGSGATAPGAVQGQEIYIPIDASIPTLEGCYLTEKTIRCGFELEDNPGTIQWSSTLLTPDMLKNFERMAEEKAAKNSTALRALIRSHPLYPTSCFPKAT